MNLNNISKIVTTSLVIFGVSACNKKSNNESNVPKQAEHISEDAKNSDVIQASESVRQNLGITFVKVERRPVSRTIRVPGQFELRPEARRTYTTALAGHVEIVVKQFEVIKKGQLLYRLNSPEWRRTQHELSESINNIKLKKVAGKVVVANLKVTEVSIKSLEQRIKQLNKAGARRADMDADLLAIRQQYKKQNSELQAADAEVEAALQHYQVMLHTTASVTGFSIEKLASKKGIADGLPFWSTLDKLSIHAQAAGIVEQLNTTNGGWATAGNQVLSTVEPKMIRFHATAPQTDIASFKTGQKVLVTPSLGSSVAVQDSMSGKLTIGFRANPQQRTIPLYVIPEKLSDWARPGMTAYLEVFVEGDGSAELAIPKNCVVRDGLTDLIFRRDPKNPDRILRVEAKLGVNDGRWVVVESGLKKGDQVVLHGAYELKLASSSKKKKSGHICSDGSWHEGEH